MVSFTTVTHADALIKEFDSVSNLCKRLHRYSLSDLARYILRKTRRALPADERTGMRLLVRCFCGLDLISIFMHTCVNVEGFILGVLVGYRS